MRIDHQQVASHPYNLGLAFVGLFDPEEVYAPVQIRSNVLHFHAVNRHGWRLTQGQRLLTIATRSRRMGLRTSALWASWTHS